MRDIKERRYELSPLQIGKFVEISNFKISNSSLVKERTDLAQIIDKGHFVWYYILSR